MREDAVPVSISRFRSSYSQQLRFTSQVSWIRIFIPFCSIVSIPLYLLFTHDYPRSFIYNDPRLDQIELLPGPHERPTELWKDNEFECIGWKASFSCNPYGLRDTFRDVPCDAPIPRVAGYCEIRNRTSGEIFQVMRSTCLSWRYYLLHDKVTCNSAREFTDYSIRAAQAPIADLPSKAKRLSIVRLHASPELQRSVSTYTEQHESILPPFLQYGIVMIAYPKVIAGVYAIIKLLHEFKCTLPIEIWHHSKEMSLNHSILQHLQQNQPNVILRSLHDPAITTFATKPYVIFHSVFENVLFLDSDNIPTRDPAFLFQSEAFLKFGAIFWPDFWHPDGDHIFNVHRQSVLWQVIDMPFIAMFEQESGQLLINRRRHHLALNRLLFYAHAQPTLLNDWSLLWGDKDLFRLAWLSTASPFYMIPHLISIAGLYDAEEDFLCGVAMVQHDPHGDILFLHRNQAKLNGRKDQKVLMTHLQKFVGSVDLHTIEMYRVQFKLRRLGQEICYRFHPVTKQGTKTPYRIESSPFAALEKKVIEWSIDGRKLLTNEEEAELNNAEEAIIAKQREEAEKIKRDTKRHARVQLFMGLFVIVFALAFGWLVQTKTFLIALSRITSWFHRKSPARSSSDHVVQILKKR